MVSKFKLGSITGALLASTLYSSATANSDTTTTQTAATTAVQTPSTDTEAGNTGSLTITTEADSAKDSQQQVSATDTTSQEASHVADSADSSDSKAQADTLSASATTASPTDNGQAVSQSTTANDKQDNDDSNNSDILASGLTNSSSTITVNIADLLNDLSSATTNTNTGSTSDTKTRTATLQYYDIINDKVVAEKVIEGTYGSVTDLDFPIPEGYTFAVDDSGLQMPKQWHFEFDDQQITYQVPVYRKADLSRTITRTINVHKPTGTETIKQPVTYVSRVSNVENNMVSTDFMMVPFSLPLQNKTKTFSTWYAIDGSSTNLNSYDVTVSAAQPDGTAEWAEYIAPEIEGYTVSQPVVSKVSVKPTDSDVTVDIYYTPEKTEPETPTNPQPEEPKVDEPKPEEPQAEEPVTPATPETPKEEQPVKVETPTSPEISTPEVAEQPAVIESNVEPAAAPVSMAPVQPAAVNNTDTQPVLPQTGNEHSNTMGITGAVSAMTGTLLAFAGSKKKRQN